LADVRTDTDSQTNGTTEVKYKWWI